MGASLLAVAKSIYYLNVMKFIHSKKRKKSDAY